MTVSSISTGYLNTTIGSAGSTLSVSGAGCSSATTWSTTTSTMRIEGGLDVSGSLKIQGQDIQVILNQINERLAILVPDEEKLKKFAALKQAYDHYKLLEQLCRDEDSK